MVKIIGHRGASEDAPENTLASIREAFAQNADGVEVDIRITKDKRIVCVHDKDMRRTSGSPLVVAESKSGELKKLDVGSWKGEDWGNEQIPLLEEVLEEIPTNKEIFIEIKTGREIIKPLIMELNNSNISFDNLSVISFKSEVIKIMKSEMEEIQANLLVAFDPELNLSDPLLPAMLKDINADGVGAQNHLNLNKRFIEEIKSLEKKVHVWTVNENEEAEKFYSLGINSITTNKPKVIRRYLNRNK